MARLRPHRAAQNMSGRKDFPAPCFSALQKEAEKGTVVTRVPCMERPSIRNYNEIIRPSVGADLSRPSPIYRPWWLFRYPDECIKTHNRGPTEEEHDYRQA